MTSEIEEAVARVEAFVAIDFRHSLRTILSALSASQAEVERLTRERDEAREVCSAHLDLEQHWNREYHKAQQRAQAAEARATRAEGLLEEAGEVLGHLVEEFGESIASYHKVGPCLTTRSDGQEYVSAGIILDREPLVEAARAFLAKLKPAETPPPVTATDTGRNT